MVKRPTLDKVQAKHSSFRIIAQFFQLIVKNSQTRVESCVQRTLFKVRDAL